GELDELAHDYIRSQDAVPSFLGYHGFTGVICASVNDEIVHGIPDRSRVLRDGDIISLDCGAIVDGWHGDSAVTVPVGQISDEDAALLAHTEEAMWRGMAAATLGGRIGDIGHAIETFAQAHGYGVVEEYT